MVTIVFHPHFPSFFLTNRHFPAQKRGHDPSRFLPPFSCPLCETTKLRIEIVDRTKKLRKVIIIDIGW